MTIPVKVFTTQITDEYGGVYPNAVVAIRAYSETSQNSAVSEDCTENYIVETELDAITYKANYWYTTTTKDHGRRSRPLISDDSGLFTDVFEVNLEDENIINILASSLHPVEKILQAIEVDLLKRFA